MKRMKANGMLALALLGLAMAAPAADPTEPVLECMRANVPQQLRIQEVELVATDKAGAVRTLRGKLYAMREAVASGQQLVRATLRIAAPDYLAGAAYLVRQSEELHRDGMYVFLPSVKRVRRVSGEFADGPLLGTNFSYYDFKQMQYAFSDATPTFEGAGELAGRPVDVLLFTPAADAGTRYSRVRSWVDRETCVPLKVEFLEGAGVRKRLSADAAALRRAGEHWYLSEVRLDDLHDQTSTVLRILGVSTGQEPPRRYFEPGSFYLGG